MGESKMGGVQGKCKLRYVKSVGKRLRALLHHIINYPFVQGNVA